MSISKHDTTAAAGRQGWSRPLAWAAAPILILVFRIGRVR